MALKRATRSTPVTTTPAPTATTTTSVTNAQLQAMINQGVSAALAALDANRNGDDIHTSGTGGRRTERVVRECTYQDFMKCKPLYFKGTEGVVELTQWFERMETVFCISNCYVENQTSKCSNMVEFPCFDLKGTDMIGYNQHFQELALLCVRMFPEESNKIERLRTKGSLKTLPETIKTNNNRTRGRTLAGLILQGLVKRSHMGDLNPYALNATITMTVRVLQNAINATKFAILLVTIGVREMPTMLIIRGALGHARNLLASSVEFKDTSRGNAQS
ncbi:hypothetical protein Tco_1063025 [Tanacetum coccineum]